MPNSTLRPTLITLIFLAGCSGIGGGESRLVPSAAYRPESARARANVRLTLTVPRRRRRDASRIEHPSTISSSTQSVSIAVNGGSEQVYNTTPSSPGCTVGSSGTTCRFTVLAPVGADTFVVTTYNGTAGSGSILDRGTAAVTIAKGRANSPSITLGPVVSTTADGGPGSLRYAVGSANPGDTILFVLPTGSTIEVSHPITLSNTISIAGPGVTASIRDRRDHATYSGITIGANAQSQIFVIGSSANASISGLILTQGKAALAQQPGGAIANAGTLSLAGDTFTGNVSLAASPLGIRSMPHKALRERLRYNGEHPHCTDTFYDGGALYNNGALSISGSTFDGNTVDSDPGSCVFGQGGAIYNDEYGTLSVEGSLFTNNATYEGGAVFNNGTDGQVSFTNDTFTGNSGCTSATACANYPYSYGAAIYDNAGPGASIVDSVFQQNVVGGAFPGSYGDGGALELNSGSPTVTGSTFSDNVAGGGSTECSTGDGAAIQDNVQVLELDNDVFTHNVSGGDFEGWGGAIYANGAIVGTNDAFTSNAAVGTGSACTSQGQAYGGAIYSNDGAITLTNSSFDSNAATATYLAVGGAIYGTAQTTLAGDSFASNAATGTGAYAAQFVFAYAGAIYYFDAGVPLAMSKCTFTSNSATLVGSNSDEAAGGAIDVAGGSLTSANDSFTSNAVSAAGGTSPSVAGGAISGTGALIIHSDTFTQNSAQGPNASYGGAIYNAGGPSIVAGSTFSSNVVAGTIIGYGGAIFDGGGLTLSGSTITKNTASQAGGGFYTDFADDSVADSTFAANLVTAAAKGDGGGGIYVADTTTIANSTISGNTVTGSSPLAGGGGIFNVGGLAMDGSTISGNSINGSVAGMGGGIFNADDTIVTNSTIAGNSSSGDGGGFATYDPSLSYSVLLTNDTLFQNHAAGSGGNIENAYQLSLANSIVAGGTAPSGPDAANGGTISSGDYNIVQTAPLGNPFGGATTHDMQADPQLLALANNGGPTWTNADQSGSPGRAHIPYGFGCGLAGAAINTDQRGFARGAGGYCDVGAYEFAGVASALRHRITRVRGHHHHARPHAGRISNAATATISP